MRPLRETKNGKTEHKLAKGSAMAVFTHHTARPVAGEVDLQLHAHCLVFPKVLGQDGKFHSHTLTDLKYEKNNRFSHYILSCDAIFCAVQIDGRISEASVIPDAS